MLPLNQGKVVPNLFEALPTYSKMLKISDILKIVEQLLDEKSLRATMHSDYHLNTLGGWHNDLGIEYGGYVQNPPSNYKIFKFGTFYSNNHSSIKNTVTQFLVNGKKFQSRVSIGDVIIFPIDITHRGFPSRISLASS